MKLKTRIFSLVGGLFLGSFLVSTILEVFFSSDAARTTNKLMNENLKSYELKRQADVSRYLKDRTDSIFATLSGALERTINLDFWNYYFMPSDFNVQTNHWLTSALFLMSNKFLDLIQTEINNQLSSQIILQLPPPDEIKAFDFIDGMKLCVIDPQSKDESLIGPMIGIPYNFDVQALSEILGQSPTDKIKKDQKFSYYLLFTPEQLKNFDLEGYESRIKLFTQINLSDPNSIVYPMTIIEILEMQKALKELKNFIFQAQKYLKNNPSFYKYITENKQTWLQDQFHNLYDVQAGVNKNYSQYEIVTNRYEQISLIWLYNSLMATGFSNYQFNNLSPFGLVSIDRNQGIGSGIKAESILDNRSIELLSPSIYLGPKGRVFLGDHRNIELNTMQGVRQTTISVGIDLTQIMSELSIVTNRNALVVVNQQMVAGTNADGQTISVKNEGYIDTVNGQKIEINTKDFIRQILDNQIGTYIDLKGDSYIFLTTKLLPDENVYIVLYRLKSVEFGFLDTVAVALKNLVRHLTTQNIVISILTLLIAAYAISRLASYITSPIVLLAKNSKEVQEGHLDKVVLPTVEDSDDEIDELYHSFSDMVQGLKEKEKVKGILNKVVSPQIANKILEGSVTLGGEEKVVTVLFADIRHFTELTEKMKPTELIQVLNSYMTRLSDVVDKNNGVIDKYIGDEIMALFGAPISDKNSVLSAVNCGLQMMKEVEVWNQNRIKLGLNPIDIGIGIHTGNVVAGNVGAENRLNYTVLGANVNLAARLCSAADARQILVSEDTLRVLGENEKIDFRLLDPIRLKGFSNPIQVYEIKEK